MRESSLMLNFVTMHQGREGKSDSEKKISFDWMLCFIVDSSSTSCDLVVVLLL